MRRLVATGAVLLCSVWLLHGTIYADPPLQSNNYRFDESVIGGSGLNQESSGSYQLGELIGDLGVGNSASTNYQVNSGYYTTSDPALTFIVDTSAVSFGNFSAAVATTTTSTFQVLDYTSYGYIVQILGSTPTNGSSVIPGLTTNTPSQAGTTQFGINLVANTSPTAVGADPNNGAFGFGVAAANYNTANSYRYISGETIASGPKSSGNTIYTLTYLVNVSAQTTGGQYTSNQTLVCIGTY